MRARARGTYGTYGRAQFSAGGQLVRAPQVVRKPMAKLWQEGFTYGTRRARDNSWSMHRAAGRGPIGRRLLAALGALWRRIRPLVQIPAAAVAV